MHSIQIMLGLIKFFLFYVLREYGLMDQINGLVMRVVALVQCGNRARALQESSLCSAETINQQTIAREPCSFPNVSPNRYLPQSPPEDILAGTDRLACRGICDVQNRKTQQQHCDRCKAGAVEQVSAQKLNRCPAYSTGQNEIQLQT